jgi:hypothetical protein
VESLYTFSVVAVVVQAEIRAAVYTAIDEEERRNGVYLENKRLQGLLRSGQTGEVESCLKRESCL